LRQTRSGKSFLTQGLMPIPSVAIILNAPGKLSDLGDLSNNQTAGGASQAKNRPLLR
jgi:hypothetical protein